MGGSTRAESVARELIEAFCAVDIQRMRALLADDLRAYITDREGGIDEVGADEYVARVEAMELPSAQFGLEITQTVAPRPGMVIVMVEVNASRGGRALHNHAAHCLFVSDGLVREWWMVEALPGRERGVLVLMNAMATAAPARRPLAQVVRFSGFAHNLPIKNRCRERAHFSSSPRPRLDCWQPSACSDRSYRRFSWSDVSGSRALLVAPSCR